MDLLVLNSKGIYRVSDFNKEYCDIGWLWKLILLFTCKRVNFTVENIELDKKYDFDKFKIEVWTNGTLYSSNLSSEGGIFMDYLESV